MRKIIHIDMDMFFAAIEIREDPSLRDKPVIVGGSPQSRGVVSTCSYEARKFGIHSGMASSRAWNLCPQAVFVRPHFEMYKQAAEQIREIFFKYTDKVETMSMDEAYLDVTENKINEPIARNIAVSIKKDILEKTGLTASAGVSYNKFLAKIGSELKKPDGLVVISPEKAQSILFNLPIGKFHGIGKVTAGKMQKIGIMTGRDLYQLELKDLLQHFGKVGAFYYYVVRGIDNREVCTYFEPKSISCETTFDKDIDNLQELLEHLEYLAQRLAARMQRKSIWGQLLSVKLRYDNFNTVSKNLSLSESIREKDEIYKAAEQVLVQLWDGTGKIRLLGIGFNKIEIGERDAEQMELSGI